MIAQEPNESRLRYLGRVLQAYFNTHPVSEYTIDYDETTCDGLCLVDEICTEINSEREHG